MRAFFGSLAQLVEQRTFNPLVAGSSPARPTKIQQEAHAFRCVGFLLFWIYLPGRRVAKTRKPMVSLAMS